MGDFTNIRRTTFVAAASLLALTTAGALAQDRNAPQRTQQTQPQTQIQASTRQAAQAPSYTGENMAQPQGASATQAVQGLATQRARTTAPAAGPVRGKVIYDLPFKGQDFRDDERVYWARDKHSDDGAVQEHGYDLGVWRYNSDSEKWAWADGDGGENKDHYVYGKPVYAMEDGAVIACWRNAPENPKPNGSGVGFWHEELTKHGGDKTRIYGGGNGLWVEHADGSRVEYAHFQPGTVPASLCPHNDALLPVIVDKPWVEKAWPHIRVTNGAQVTKGQKLGLAGNSGTSSGPHLHIHRETGGQAGATKSGGNPLRMYYRSGIYVAGTNHSAWTSDWKSFAGDPIPPGPNLWWPSRSKFTEHARHGLNAERFGALFDHLTDSGFWPEWIDAYNVGGTTFLNYIWRPAQGAWRSYYLVSEGKYQTEFDKAKADNFYPVFVESSKSGNQVRYTAVWVKNKPGGYLARHDLNYDQHMAVIDEAKAQNLVPVNVSVVSAGNGRRYTVLYRSGNIGGWNVKSQIPESGYQAEYDAQKGAGRRPLYLNAYMHGGQPYISAIFGQVSTPARKDRHLMSAGQYQTEYESARAAGMLTRAVTSFDGAQSQHRYAAAWWK